MSYHAITVNEDDSLLQAAHLMMRFKISGLPVVSKNNKIVGIITATDLFALMGKTAHSFESSAFASLRVSNVMTETVYTIKKETSFFRKTAY